ncbi:hypothetical protein D1007_45839 [Hordeum vulgare]|nr:hypothetical protein D1007_45839 [Hordeum vulgare]
MLVKKRKWPREHLPSPKNLTVHEIKQLNKKKHAKPRIPPDHPKDVFATSDSDFENMAEAHPYWVSKLTDQVKKTFYLQSHVHKKLYEAHVNEKLAERRDSDYMDDDASGHPSTSTSADDDDIMEDDEESHGDDTEEDY